MIGSEFAGNLSKNLGTTIGKLDNTLKEQIYQLKDLALQKAKTRAEAEISSQIKTLTGVEIGLEVELGSVDLKNFTDNLQSTGQNLAQDTIQDQKAKALDKLKDQSSKSKKIIAICKKIKRIISQIQGPIEKLSTLINKITTIIVLAKNILKVLSALLKLLKANPTLPIAPPLPVPVAPGATVPGIPIIYPTAGANLTAGQVATKIQKFIDKTSDLLDSLSKTLVTVSKFITQTVGLLKVIKPLLNSLCPDDKTPSVTPPPSLNGATSDISSESAIDGITDQLLNLIPKELIETEDSYKGYTFQVIEDKTQTSASGKVNKRYVVALNSQGIETFRSQSSFATDKQILIAELKFKIDNDLSNSSVQESV